MALLSFLSSKNDRSSTDGAWNQNQREALVDLLYLAIYADNHLSQLEEHSIRKELDQIEWTGSQGLSYATDRAIARARSARAAAEGETELLKSIGQRLETGQAKTKALEVCGIVLRSDGTDPRESEFMSKAKSAFDAQG